MAISVDWAGTKVIFVPKADTTLVSAGPPEIRTLDANDLRLWLKDVEDDPLGMPWPRTHNHATRVTLSGVTYERSLEIIAGYTIEFEDGQYTVNITGPNNNIADVAVANQVRLVINNSAGKTVETQVSGGGGGDCSLVGGLVVGEAL